MKFELVREIERELMPSMHELCQSLRPEMPDADVRVFSNDVGQATPNPWHVLGVGCRLKDWDDRIVEAMIMVYMGRLTTNPIIAVSVCWDWATVVGLMDEVEQTEAELFAQPVPVSDESVQMVKVALPGLVQVLRRAVKRGFPAVKVFGVKSVERAVVDEAE